MAQEEGGCSVQGFSLTFDDQGQIKQITGSGAVSAVSPV